jgi:hypothetical protein
LDERFHSSMTNPGRPTEGDGLLVEPALGA